MIEIKHLRGRERKLSVFGWSPQEANVGRAGLPSQRLVTRAQFCAHFGGDSRPAWHKQATRFVQALVTKKLGIEEPLDGLPTTTRPCRISTRASIAPWRSRTSATGGPPAQASCFAACSRSITSWTIRTRAGCPPSRRKWRPWRPCRSPIRHSPAVATMGGAPVRFATSP